MVCGAVDKRSHVGAVAAEAHEDAVRQGIRAAGVNVAAWVRVHEGRTHKDAGAENEGDHWRQEHHRAVKRPFVLTPLAGRAKPKRGEREKVKRNALRLSKRGEERVIKMIILR
jgi:hypothetical protein